MRIAFLFALALPASTAMSQQQDVPRDVVLGLLKATSPTAEVRELTVGSAPRGFPRELIPPGTILGGVETGGLELYAPGSRTVVVRVALDADSAAEMAEAHVERAGARLAPSMGELGGGGFVASPGPANMRYRCRDTTLVITRSSARAEGGSYVSISLSDSRRSMCTARDSQLHFVRSNQLPLPTLVPPRRVRAFPSGGSGGDGHRTIGARHVTTQTPKELVDHYAPQLTADGWSLGGRLDTKDLSILSATKTDREGRRLLGTLIAASFGENDRHVTFSVITASEMRSR